MPICLKWSWPFRFPDKNCKCIHLLTVRATCHVHQIFFNFKASITLGEVLLFSLCPFFCLQIFSSSSCFRRNAHLPVRKAKGRPHFKQHDISHSLYRGADKSLARPDWKKKLKFRHLSSDVEVNAAAETWLDGQRSELFLSGLQKVRIWSL